MTQEDVQGHIAWQEYYDGMESMYDMRPQRKTFWENRHYKLFVRIGMTCLRNGLDTAEYMRAAMHMLNKDHEYISPKDFTNPRLIARYIDRKQKGRGIYERSWLTQTMELTTMACDTVPHLYASEIAILLEPRLPFEAWFRVLYLTPFNAQLYAAFGRTAWSQLQKEPSLRAFLRKQAPANMTKLEDELGKLDVTG
jgi:hypothetical protein